MRRKIIAVVTALSLAGMCSLYVKPRNSREKISQSLEKKVCQNLLYIPKGTDIRDLNFAIHPDCVRYAVERKELEVKADNFDSKKHTPTQRIYSNSRNNFNNNLRSNIEKLMINICNKYGVNPNFVKAMIRAESDFDPYAVSEMGAVGIMQLMPKTAKKLNLHVPDYRIKKVIEDEKTKYISKCNKQDFEEDESVCDLKNDERFDPKKNMEAGIFHISGLFKKHNGNLELVLVEYHAGNSALDNGKVWRYNCYEDTRNYVKTVMKYYKEYKNI